MVLVQFTAVLHTLEYLRMCTTAILTVDSSGRGPGEEDSALQEKSLHIYWSSQLT
jgi:hypothetical protein